MALPFGCVFIIVELTRASKAESLCRSRLGRTPDTPGPEPCLLQLRSAMNAAKTSCGLQVRGGQAYLRSADMLI